MLTPRETEIIREAIGYPRPLYRNTYSVELGSADNGLCERMTRQGLMRLASVDDNGRHIYKATLKGYVEAI